MDVGHEGGRPVIRIDGRLDAERSVHLADALEGLLRSGVRAAVVDLSRASFVSTPGIGVLTRYAQDFLSLRGELLVGAPPPAVRDALGRAGLGDRVLPARRSDPEQRPRLSGALDLQRTRDWTATAAPVRAGRYEITRRDRGASLLCHVLGPALALDGGAAPETCTPVSFAEPRFGLGIGALGSSYDECRTRFGELLGAGGAVIHRPTEGSGIPDHLLSMPDHPARAMLLSGLTCEGGFSHLVRFAHAHAVAGAVPLAELIDVCLDAADAEVAGVVMVAEVAGLLGAYLRRSPALRGEQRSADLREWITITAGPSYGGTTALIVGVLARPVPPTPALSAQLRPLGSDSGPRAHLHAAVFGYRPVPQRTMAVGPVVHGLLEQQELRAVLHVLDRPGDAEPERGSSFLRGLAWVAPIREIAGIVDTSA